MTTLIKTNGAGKGLIFPQFPALFDDFITKDFINLTSKPNVPEVNIRESETSFCFEVAAPGKDKSNFKIELKENILSVSATGENISEDKNENGSYIRKEFNYQSFTRSFTLPVKDIDENNISANYTNGILYISVPKKEKEKANSVKQITIN